MSGFGSRHMVDHKAHGLTPPRLSPWSSPLLVRSGAKKALTAVGVTRHYSRRMLRQLFSFRIGEAPTAHCRCAIFYLKLV